MSSSSPSVPIPSPRGRAAAVRTLVALTLLAGALTGAPSAPRAAAGEPDTAAAPSTPRLAALEQEIRHLEKSLQALRRARAELTAGRPEPVPVDAPARAAFDARRAALREVARYEGARARALAAHSEAVSAKDDAKVVEARAALDAADAAFVAALQKIDARAEAQSTADPQKGDPQKADAPKNDGTPRARPPAPAGGDGRSPGRRGARQGGGSSMGAGDDVDDADDDDED